MTKVLYFGRLSDLTGVQSEKVSLPPGIKTAGELRVWLDDRFEAGGQLRDETVRIALNNEITFDSALISEQDEIAFMPPVGGG